MPSKLSQDRCDCGLVTNRQYCTAARYKYDESASWHEKENGCPYLRLETLRKELKDALEWKEQYRSQSERFSKEAQALREELAAGKLKTMPLCR